MNLTQVIEALLFSAQKPLTTKELVSAIKGAGDTDELIPNEFAKTNAAEIAAALQQLKIEYIEQHRAFQLAEKSEGWQLVSDPDLRTMGSPVISRGQTGPVKRAFAGNACHHRLSPANYASRRRSSPRRGRRRRPAKSARTRIGSDRGPRRSPWATVALRNHPVFPGAFRLT